MGVKNDCNILIVSIYFENYQSILISPIEVYLVFQHNFHHFYSLSFISIGATHHRVDVYAQTDGLVSIVTCHAPKESMAKTAKKHVRAEMEQHAII